MHISGTTLSHGSERLLLYSLLASTIGDEITQVALVFRVVPTGSGSAMAFLLTSLLIPGAVVAPYAGKLVDERDAAAVLVATSLLQALVVAALAFTSRLEATLVGACALSVLFAFSGAATFALIPVVGRMAGLSVARVNSVVELASGGGSVFGPVIGGGLVAAGGIAAALIIDAVSFALLAAALIFSRLSRPSQVGSEGAKWLPLAVLSGYAPVLRRPGILLFLLSLWGVVAALAVSDAVYVFLVTRVLGLGPLAYGIIIGAWASTYLLGAWVAGSWAQRRPHALALAGGSAMAASFLAIGLGIPHVGPVGATVVGTAFLIGGFGNAVRNVAVRTLLHTGVPAELHGRAAALYGGGTRLAEAGGFVGGGMFGPARVLLAYTFSGIAALIATGTGAVFKDR